MEPSNPLGLAYALDPLGSSRELVDNEGEADGGRSRRKSRFWSREKGDRVRSIMACNAGRSGGSSRPPANDDGAPLVKQSQVDPTATPAISGKYPIHA